MASISVAVSGNKQTLGTSIEQCERIIRTCLDAADPYTGKYSQEQRRVRFGQNGVLLLVGPLYHRGGENADFLIQGPSSTENVLSGLKECLDAQMREIPNVSVSM